MKTRPINEEDVWFAWYPVRLGAWGIGRLVWLRRVWRNRNHYRGQTVTIYQTLDVAGLK